MFVFRIGMQQIRGSSQSVYIRELGGFRVLKAANLGEALAWGRKAAVACRAPVEVRAFN